MNKPKKNNRSVLNENLYGQQAGELQPLYLQERCKQVFGYGGLLHSE